MLKISGMVTDVRTTKKGRVVVRVADGGVVHDVMLPDTYDARDFEENGDGIRGKEMTFSGNTRDKIFMFGDVTE